LIAVSTLQWSDEGVEEKEISGSLNTQSVITVYNHTHHGVLVSIFSLGNNTERIGIIICNFSRLNYLL